MTPRWQEDRGAAMLYTLVLLMAMSLLLGNFMRSVNYGIGLQQDHHRALAAQQLAEAGIEKAFAALREGPYTGEIETPLGAGRFSVRVEARAPGDYRVTSIGETLVDGVPFARAIQAAEIQVDGGAVVRMRVQKPRSWEDET